MPRLDEGNPKTVEALDKMGVNVVSTPIDVCLDCYDCLDTNDDVDHPPYNDGAPPYDYRCAICDTLLTIYDDWPVPF